MEMNRKKKACGDMWSERCKWQGRSSLGDSASRIERDEGTTLGGCVDNSQGLGWHWGML